MPSLDRLNQCASLYPTAHISITGRDAFAPLSSFDGSRCDCRTARGRSLCRPARRQLSRSWESAPRPGHGFPVSCSPVPAIPLQLQAAVLVAKLVGHFMLKNWIAFASRIRGGSGARPWSS